MDLYHNRFPTDKDWADKWEQKIKENDPSYRRKSNDIVCSLHFAKSAMKPVSRQLVDHALPVSFPNAKPDFTRNGQSPQRTICVKQPIESTYIKSVPDSTSSDSKCCVVGCQTKFNETNPKIHGFRYCTFWRFIYC